MRLFIDLLILFLFVSCFPTAPDNTGGKLKSELANSNTNNTGDISVIQKFIKVNPLFSSFNYIVSENSSFITSVNIVDSTGATLTSANGVLEIGVFSDSQCSIPVEDGYVGSPISTVTNGVATFPGFGLTKPVSSTYVIRFMKFTYNSGLSFCSNALRVYAMLLSYSNSLVTIQDGTGTYVNTTSGFKNVSRQVKVTLKNSLGVQLSSGGYIVSLTQGGGTSSISLGAVTDNGDGTYSATLTGLTKGTQRTITAAVSGSPLTSNPAKYAVDNSPPVISTISDQTVQQYMSGNPISYTVTDIDGDTVNCSSLSSHTSTASSVFTAIASNISGTSPNCVYSLKSIGTAGAATIKMKYTDGTTPSAERSFTINSVSPAILQLQEAPIFRGVMVNYQHTKTFTLKNVGGTKATALTNIEALMDPFVYIAGTCNSMLELNPGDTCTFDVRYTPTAVKVDQGALSFSYNDGVGVRRFSQTFAGSGEQIRVSQSELDFSATRIGGTAEKILLVHNPTEHSIVLDFQFSGATTGDGEYLFYPSFPGKIHNSISLENPCVAGAVMTPKYTCEVAVTYKPITINSFNASLLIRNTNMNPSPVQTVTLKGYGYTDSLTGFDSMMNTCTCDPSNTQACGDGSTANPYLICAKSNLDEIADHFVFYANKNFKLVSDIDLTSFTKYPIGDVGTPFTGSLNGNNFSLRGFSPNFTSSYQGLFARMNSASIFNLYIPDYNAEFASVDIGGILAGFAENTQFKNILIQGVMDASDSSNIGGLIGDGLNLSVFSTDVSNSITGFNSVRVGAVIGRVIGLQADLGSIYSLINIPSSHHVGGYFGGATSSVNFTRIGIKTEAHEIDNYLAGIGNIEDGFIIGSDINVFGYFQSGAFPLAASFLADFSSTSGATTSSITNSYASSEFINTISGGLIGEMNLTASGSKLTLSSVHVNSKVTGKDINGGVITQQTDGGLVITDLTNIFQFIQADPTGTSVGGVIGYSSSTDSTNLTGITSLVDIVDTNGPSGGIAGKINSSNTTITTASIYGLVNSSGHAGGIMGEWISPKIKFGKNYSNIVSPNTCGGFVGVGSNPTVSSSSILESFNLGNIYCDTAAGLVGDVFSSSFLSTYVIMNNYVGGTISGNTMSAGLVGLLGANPFPTSEKNVVVLDTFVSNTSDIYPFGTSSHTGLDYFWMSGNANSIEKPVWYPTAQTNEKFYSGTQMAIQGNFSNLNFPSTWTMGGYFHFPYKP